MGKGCRKNNCEKIKVVMKDKRCTNRKLVKPSSDC